MDLISQFAASNPILSFAGAGLASLLAFLSIKSTLFQASSSRKKSRKWDINMDYTSSDSDPDVSNRRRNIRRRRVAPTYVFGLVNVGNSCFLNSILQSLAALPKLRYYLERRIETQQKANMAKSLNVTAALLETVNDLNTPLKYRKAIRPTSLLRAISNNKRIVNRQQQDAQELFQIISSALSEEQDMPYKAAVSILNPTILRELISHSSLNSSFNKHLLKASHNTRVNSRSLNPFTGLLASRLTCLECGYTVSRLLPATVSVRSHAIYLTEDCPFRSQAAIRHFTFDNLSLSLPRRSVCTLEDCLSSYNAIETIHDACCRRCSLKDTLKQAINEIVKWTRQLERFSNKVAFLKSEILAMSVNADDLSSESFKLEKDRRRKKKSLREYEEAVTEVCDFLSELKTNEMSLRARLKDDVEGDVGKIELQRAETRHTKQLMIARPPSVLAIHFSRSLFLPFGVSKNNCHVEFPQHLDLTPFVTTGSLSTAAYEPISDFLVESKQIVQQSNGDDVVHSIRQKPNENVSEISSTTAEGDQFSRDMTNGNVGINRDAVDSKNSAGVTKKKKKKRKKNRKTEGHDREGDSDKENPIQLRETTVEGHLSDKASPEVTRLKSNSPLSNNNPLSTPLHHSSRLSSTPYLPSPPPDTESRSKVPPQCERLSSPLSFGDIHSHRPQPHTSHAPRYHYKLQSVVVHYGAHEWGHYIAYRRVPKWNSTPNASSSPSITAAQPSISEAANTFSHDAVGHLKQQSRNGENSSNSKKRLKRKKKKQNFNGDGNVRKQQTSFTSPSADNASLSDRKAPTSTFPIPASVNFTAETQCDDDDDDESDWFRISDDNVEIVSWEEVKQARAYMVFYELMES
ncbi:hypothetical protein BKA69DRAFT_289319 [Paraphysoderma sedebokerense]|nr:hypothetical protein BKA69DRAFT_289319 [Paraphysoderma sedebokerense]